MNTAHAVSRRGRRPILPHSSPSRSAIASVFAVSILIILTAASASAVPIFGVSAANNLVRFDSATPGTFVSTTPITGLVAGDTIVALDFRPVDGKLFGLGSGSRLYIIDPVTAAATQVGTGTFGTLNGSAFGFDFNPTVDRIRLVSDANQNLPLDPHTRGLLAPDPPPAFCASASHLPGHPHSVTSA